MRMKIHLAIAACVLALPAVAFGATRTYDLDGFEKVSVAAGVTVDIRIGTARSIVAETSSAGFDELRVTMERTVLRIERMRRSWFSFSRRPSYRVHIVTPVLSAVTASSGAEVEVTGTVQGDLSVEASSGSEVDVAAVQGGNVRVSTSSGSDVRIAGTCVSLDAESSSGSDLDADGLRCENVSVRASSGSDASVVATRSVTGAASSGSDIRVAGHPQLVQVEKSSGADVEVRQ
jgi:hypothetical protein